MGLSSKLIVSGAVAGVALSYYVRTRHQRTGLSYLSIIRQLPGDALRWVDDTRDRAARALEEGKVVARRRDEEFTRQLAAAGTPTGT